MKYLHYSSEQYLFERLFNGLLIAFKLACNGIVYFPQLFTGYCIARCVLSKEDNGILWLLLTCLFAFVIFLFVFFLKGIIIAFKMKRNYWWVAVFVLCVLYTCVLPVVLFSGLLYKAAFYFTVEHATVLGWLFGIVVCGCIYRKYDFLNDTAPRIAAVSYKSGINTGKLL